MTPTISIILPSLSGGGVERMRLALAREFLRVGYRVDIVLMREEGSLLSEVPEQVRVVGLSGGPRLRSCLWPLARYFHAERPAAVLAAMWPLTAITVMAGRGGDRPRIVVSDHNVLSRQRFAQSLGGQIALRATIRLTYPHAESRVAVSDGVAREIASLGGLSASSMTVIPNPAYPPTLSMDAPDPWLGLPDGERVLSVCRLKPQKDVPLLVRAFARVAAERPATLVVLGDGPERTTVEDLASELGVADRVVLPGFANDTGPWYAHADAFALASRYEGFGNVLVEALAYGLPIVSTDCPAGPRDVLAGDTFGRLVPVGDAEALADGLRGALDEKEGSGARLLHRRQTRAREFKVGPIAEQYLELLFPNAV